MAFYHYQSESEDDSEGIDGEDDDNRRRQAPSHASCRRWRDDDDSNDSDIDLSSESEGEEDGKDVEDYQDSELAKELFGVKINRGQTQGEEAAQNPDSSRSRTKNDNPLVFYALDLCTALQRLRDIVRPRRNKRHNPHN